MEWKKLRKRLAAAFVAGTLAFSVKTDGIDPNDYALLSFEFFMGNYLVTDDVFLGRQLHKVIIDTGACIPYISKRLSSMFEHTGEMYHDISPSFGVLQGEYLRGDLICYSDDKPFRKNGNDAGGFGYVRVIRRHSRRHGHYREKDHL